MSPANPHRSLPVIPPPGRKLSVDSQAFDFAVRGCESIRKPVTHRGPARMSYGLSVA